MSIVKKIIIVSLVTKNGVNEVLLCSKRVGKEGVRYKGQ